MHEHRTIFEVGYGTVDELTKFLLTQVCLYTCHPLNGGRMRCHIQATPNVASPGQGRDSQCRLKGDFFAGCDQTMSIIM